MGHRDTNNVTCSCGACFKGHFLYGKGQVLYRKGWVIHGRIASLPSCVLELTVMSVHALYRTGNPS